MLRISVDSYLSQLHELPDLRHPGQEPLVDLQGFLTVTLLHLEVFLCTEQEIRPIVLLEESR